MIPLLDIHFLLNKKRGSLNPISPKETLRICEDMPNIYKFPVKISIYNNLKVIEKSKLNLNSQVYINFIL